MYPAAVIKARRKLTKLHDAVEALRAADRADKIVRAWEEFVLTSGTIYSALEQGSKISGKSQAWFGRKKRDRKKDQLLRYLHFARNSEEHGLEEITEIASSSIELGPGASVRLMSDGVSKWHIVDTSGTVTPKNDIICLVRVNDRRFGDFADPPREHLGEKIESDRPLAVAEAAIGYFDLMLEEAQALVQSS